MCSAPPMNIYNTRWNLRDEAVITPSSYPSNTATLLNGRNRFDGSTSLDEGVRNSTAHLPFFHEKILMDCWMGRSSNCNWLWAFFRTPAGIGPPPEQGGPRHPVRPSDASRTDSKKAHGDNLAPFLFCLFSCHCDEITTAHLPSHFPTMLKSPSRHRMQLNVRDLHGGTAYFITTNQLIGNTIPLSTIRDCNYT